MKVITEQNTQTAGQLAYLLQNILHLVNASSSTAQTRALIDSADAVAEAIKLELVGGEE